jgi:hypothetical protein
MRRIVTAAIEYLPKAEVVQSSSFSLLLANHNLKVEL